MGGLSLRMLFVVDQDSYKVASRIRQIHSTGLHCKQSTTVTSALMNQHVPYTTVGIVRYTMRVADNMLHPSSLVTSIKARCGSGGLKAGS